MIAHDKIARVLRNARLNMIPNARMEPDIDEALATLAELERAAKEPVAWMWNDELGIPHASAGSKRPVWLESSASAEYIKQANLRPLYAAPPAPVAEIREVVVTDEMCARVGDAWYAGFGNRAAMASGRDMIAAVRAELGPALGLVELKWPTPEECERICTEYERLLMREGTCGGRDAFDAVRAVMWPKSEGL